MKQSIGGISMLNIIIIFLVLVFAFLAGTISYYKAFKINRRILNAIETYEGYNGAAQISINNSLEVLGYTRGSSNNCDLTHKDGDSIGQLISYENNGYSEAGMSNKIQTKLADEEFDYCIYAYKDTTRNVENDTNYYYSYGVVTYIHINLPIINQSIKIPVFTRTEKIYKFTTE